MATVMVQPAASPSSPSVRLTAFELPTMVAAKKASASTPMSLRIGSWMNGKYNWPMKSSASANSRAPGRRSGRWRPGPAACARPRHPWSFSSRPLRSRQESEDAEGEEDEEGRPRQRGCPSGRTSRVLSVTPAMIMTPPMVGVPALRPWSSKSLWTSSESGSAGQPSVR